MLWRARQGSDGRRPVLEPYGDILAVDSHHVPPRPPRPGTEPNPGRNPNIEVDDAVAAASIGSDSLSDVVIDVLRRSHEARLDSGGVPLALVKGRERGLGDVVGSVEDGSGDAVVVDAHLVVRVADGEGEVEVGGEELLGGGEVEGGDGGGGNGEGREAGVEDEPEDEDDERNEEEEGDGDGEEAAEEDGVRAGGSAVENRGWRGPIGVGGGIVGGGARRRGGVGVGGGVGGSTSGGRGGSGRVAGDHRFGISRRTHSSL